MKRLDPEDVDDISPGVLAYIGDAVFELYVRMNLLRDRRAAADLDELHREATARVCAKAQARALADLDSFLLPDEAEIARRARNVRTGRGPRSMPVLDYRHSTGFEAVIGYLYLLGRDERLEEVIAVALAAIEARLGGGT